ncbi:MAG: hypothetical protein U1U88_000950 [Lawsonella clevelandensis]
MMSAAAFTYLLGEFPQGGEAGAVSVQVAPGVDAQVEVGVLQSFAGGDGVLRCGPRWIGWSVYDKFHIS